MEGVLHRTEGKMGKSHRRKSTMRARSIKHEAQSPSAPADRGFVLGDLYLDLQTRLAGADKAADSGLFRMRRDSLVWVIPSSPSRGDCLGSQWYPSK